MSTNTPAKKEVRWAVEDDAQPILEVWQEVSEWLIQMGEPLWSPAQFTLAETRTLIKLREVCVGLENDQLVSCMRVSSADKVYWPEKQFESALYLHKIAVRRSRKSKGWANRMIDWVDAQAAGAGLNYIRLDCDPRPALLAVYEASGFSKYEPLPVSRGGFMVQRMQRRIQRTDR